MGPIVVLLQIAGQLRRYYPLDHLAQEGYRPVVTEAVVVETLLFQAWNNPGNRKGP